MKTLLLATDDDKTDLAAACSTPLREGSGRFPNRGESIESEYPTPHARYLIFGYRVDFCRYN